MVESPTTVSPTVRPKAWDGLSRPVRWIARALAVYLLLVAVPAAALQVAGVTAGGPLAILPLAASSVFEGWGFLVLAAASLWRGRGAFFLVYLGTLFTMAVGKAVFPVALGLLNSGWGSFLAAYWFNLAFCGLVICLHWVWRYQRWAAGRHRLRADLGPASPPAGAVGAAVRPRRWPLLALALLLAVAVLWPISHRQTLALRGSLVQPSLWQWRWCDLRSAAGGLEVRYARSQYLDARLFADEATGAYLLMPSDRAERLPIDRRALGFQFGYGYLPNAYSLTWGYDIVVPYWALAAVGVGWIARRLRQRSRHEHS